MITHTIVLNKFRSMIPSIANFWLVAALTCAGEEAPKPPSELVQLKPWTGRWAYEGEAEPNPFGPTGKFSGAETIRKSLNGFVIENKWKDTSASGYVSQGIVLTRFDSTQGKFIEHSFDAEGNATVSPLEIQGETLQSTFSKPGTNGTMYLLRATRSLGADKRSYTAKVEYSADQGSSWTLWFAMSGKKASR